MAEVVKVESPHDAGQLAQMASSIWLETTETQHVSRRGIHVNGGLPPYSKADNGYFVKQRGSTYLI